MADKKEVKKSVKYVKVVKENNSAGFVWFVGAIGAAVYYIQVADGFWEVIVALLKALVWPAFLVYEVLRFLAA